MFFRIRKFAVASTYLALLWLTVRFFTGKIDLGLETGCILLSGLWLTLSTITLRSIFALYFNWFTRLRFRLTFYAGVASSLLVFLSAAYHTLPVTGKGDSDIHPLTSPGAAPWMYEIALVELCLWFVLFFLYQRNAKKFIKTGHGPVPASAWLNVPPEVIRPGFWVIFSGSFGPGRENPAGHAELCYDEADGKRKLLSCWIPKGFVVHDLADLMARWLKSGAHHTVLRPRVPFTKEEMALAPQISAQMKADNIAWVTKVTKRRRKIINRLPIPERHKQSLLAKFTPTGYDWKGLIIGTRSADHWTCIGACLEFLERMGRKVRAYGTGLLGLGTGLLDPLNPARLYDDPNYELLTLDHQAYYLEHGDMPPVGWQPPGKSAQPQSFCKRLATALGLA